MLSYIYLLSTVMLKIKLYVILSTILVFNLFEESSARGGGGKTIGRRNKFCRGGSGGGSGGPSGSIDCKYFLKANRYIILKFTKYMFFNFEPVLCFND